MDKDLITIDTKKIILSRNKAGEIVLSLEAREQLQKVLDFKRLADEVYSYVQDQLTTAMGKQEIKKIVAGNIVIARRLFGSRFEAKNIQEVQPQFLKEIKYSKPDSEEIEKFFEKNGELPVGIDLKPRTEKATITERDA